MKDLLNIIGTDFTGRPVPDDLEKAVWLVKQLFPKNRCFPAGSVAIHGEGRDVDVVMRGSDEDVAKALEIGFKRSTERVYRDAPFISLTYNKLNLIVMLKGKEFNRFKLALEVCQSLTGYIDVDKEIRIAIHETLRNAK